MRFFIYYGMKFSEIPSRVHFVGIGGVGQSALAKHLLRIGRVVSGSDRENSPALSVLQKLGAKVYVGHDVANVGSAELVVRTSAVGTDNVEVAYAQHHGIPVVLREQLLGAIVNDFCIRIAISGTHGKTTTTAMLHHIAERCGVSHVAFIGGEYEGSNYYGGENTVIVEACEYNRSFFELRPTVAVCLNVEYDHPDCYADYDDTCNAFAQFVASARDGVAVLPVELAYLAQGKCVTFGKTGDVYAENVALHDGKPHFDLYVGGKYVAHVEMAVVGLCNVTDALCTMAVAYSQGYPLLQAAQSLCTFGGVYRRWTEHFGICRIVADYAHHPTEIRSSVETALSLSKHVVCVFQPHTFSRTKAFWQQFADCFRGATVVYLPIFAAREKPIDGVNSNALATLARQCGVDAYYADSFAEARSIVLAKVTSATDTVLVLGAGNVVDFARLL